MISWDELTFEQRNSVGRLQHWLDVFGSGPIGVEAGGPGFLPSTRVPMYSNVLFLDDPQGSILTFLLGYWKDLYLDGFEATRDRSPEAPATSGNSEVLASWRSLTQPRFSIVPFNPISLDPIPSDTSLILMVTQRLYEVFETTTKKVVCLPFEPSSEMEPERAWREFQGLASRWEGNLEARKGYLDPEAYAVELEYTERSRLGLPQSWRRLVDSLVRYAEDHLRRSNPVLVVPITGSDLNPRVGSELLKATKLMSHERVVFILTGVRQLAPSELQIL
jgi:hypothetical protein